MSTVSKIFPPSEMLVIEAWYTAEGYSAEHRDVNGDTYMFLAVSRKHLYYLQLKDLYKNRMHQDSEVHIRHAAYIAMSHTSKTGTVFGWMGPDALVLLNCASLDISRYQIYRDLLSRPEEPSVNLLEIMSNMRHAQISNLIQVQQINIANDVPHIESVNRRVSNYLISNDIIGNIPVHMPEIERLMLNVDSEPEEPRRRSGSAQHEDYQVLFNEIDN